MKIFERLFKSNKARASRHREQRAKKLQLDHDASGKAGGSLPAKVRGLDELRAEVEAKGGVADKRWGQKRLLAEIAAIGGVSNGV